MKPLVGIALIVCCLGAAPAESCAGASAAPCSTYTVGIDTSLANNSGDVILGEAIGQTFFASDTLLKSLTVWRVADECQNFLIGMHLYVTRADSTGKPLTSQIVLNGPTITIPDGDCIHPIPFYVDL